MSIQDNIPEQKNIFVVLGMARSGTSVIARGLKALGIDLGNNLIPAKSNWNAKGYWEDSDIVYRINRGAIRALNFSWETENLIDLTHADMHDLQNLAVQLLKQHLASTQYWGFKDPRTAKLLPFWKSVFDTLNVNEHYVIALRNPLASAHSFTKLSQYDLEVGLVLWLMHLIPAIDHTIGKNRIVVSYDLMLQNTRKQLERVKKNFHIPELTNDADLDLYANEFLDKKLHHYAYSDEDLKSHPTMVIAPLCTKVYDLLMRVARDEISLEDEAFLSTWNDIKSEYAIVHPIYCYLGVLMNKNKQLERQIRHINKSVIWKMFYPLRIMEDAIRAFRRKSKQKRRLAKTYG